ncbi:LytTR family DNA-binding domain-containing protein [Rhizobium lusitanum]|uniref:HTH LytTR-type domain-containing protein n=1 Tax=Rhizobium lusitanum TaxID=293958 RepID=A0A7X0MDZ4_9HYPH|nr:LytTR family DNA-binding domain-containing protein [Rhizobium lusitanum]MBB6487134.1 hypothetical protein [Rhizobium lusitanum]
MSVGTSGDFNVTKVGRFGLDVASFTTIAAGVAAVDLSNIFTLAHNSLRHGPDAELWIPSVTEATSGVSILGALWIVVLALRHARPGQMPWLFMVFIHAFASLCFSAQHVVTMVVMRITIFGIVGAHYHFEPGDCFYEYRKDVLTYLLITALLTVCHSRAQTPKRDKAPEFEREATFDIRVRGQTVRVPLRAVLALRAAGNYVEVLLEDGRRLLLRGTLSSYTERLTPSGFERTHRSWLVNGARIVGLRNAGSGDMHVDLPGGYEAPLSRRYREVLKRLKHLQQPVSR